MLNSNSLLFAFGAITFLVTFSWFKYAAMEGIWSKLFKVFLVDWIVCALGVLGTGILFVVIFNLAH
jgi:hypothetical protein